MEITTTVFTETAPASSALQRKDLDLSESDNIVGGVMGRLKEMKKDEELKVLVTKAKEEAGAAGAEVPDEIPGQARHRQVPTSPNRLQDYKPKA